MICCIMLSLKYSLECCTCFNLFEFEIKFEFGFENPIEKEMEKEIENPGKKKKAISAQTSPPGQVPRAPAAPDRRTPPVGGSPVLCVPSLSGSLPSGASLSAPVTSPARSPSLSLFCGPGSPVPNCCPYAPPFLSVCRGPPLSAPPSPHVAVERRMRTRAHRRVSRPRRPPTRPTLFL
jgi:hypothetical protein